MHIIQKHEAVFEEAEKDLVKPFMTSLTYCLSFGS